MRGGGDGHVPAPCSQTLLQAAVGTCGDPAQPSELIFLSAASFAAGDFCLIPLRALQGAKPPGQAVAVAAVGLPCLRAMPAGAEPLFFPPWWSASLAVVVVSLWLSFPATRCELPCHGTAAGVSARLGQLSSRSPGRWERPCRICSGAEAPPCLLRDKAMYC